MLDRFSEDKFFLCELFNEVRIEFSKQRRFQFNFELFILNLCCENRRTYRSRN